MTQYNKLVKAAENSQYKLDHIQKQKVWNASPFAWVHLLPSRTRGAFAEQLIDVWLGEQGFSSNPSGVTNFDRKIENFNFEIKFSTLWVGGFYKFQQIRQSDYDYLLCLGVRPDGADLWIAEYEDLISNWTEIGGQHTGASAKETKWIQIHPREEKHDILIGGDIDKGYEVLCNKLKKS